MNHSPVGRRPAHSRCPSFSTRNSSALRTARCSLPSCRPSWLPVTGKPMKVLSSSISASRVTVARRMCSPATASVSVRSPNASAAQVVLAHLAPCHCPLIRGPDAMEAGGATVCSTTSPGIGVAGRRASFLDGRSDPSTTPSGNILRSLPDCHLGLVQRGAERGGDGEYRTAR